MTDIPRNSGFNEENTTIDGLRQLAADKSKHASSRYVLRGIQVFGAEGFSDGSVVDLAVTDGMISGIGHDLPAAEHREVMCSTDGGSSMAVSPPWIDVHAHVYHGATDIGIKPGRVGFATGVHCVVDAGSAGEANFAGLDEFVIQNSAERILAYLNIGPIGVTAANRVSEYAVPEAMDEARFFACVEKFRPVLAGVKARVSGIIVGDRGMEVLRWGQKVARQVDLPLIVHVGEGPPDLAELLDAMEPGDMATHCYHGKPGNSAQDPRIRRSLQAAADRGVLLDVGHGEASFSFDTAELCIAEGLKPFSISTDVHARNLNGPVWDLPTTMSKLWTAGLSLSEVIAAVTEAPQRFLQPALGSGYDRLAVGGLANFTVFSMEKLNVSLADSMGVHRLVEQGIIPRAVATAGVIRSLDAPELPGPMYESLLSQEN